MPEEPHGQPFLSTARALGACARELARLSDCIAEQAADAFVDAVGQKITVRRSPDRCIVQIGSSALSVAWIRTRRDSADGELLAIHWRGIIGPSMHWQPERGIAPTVTARALSESMFSAEATSEADWMWRSRDEPALRYSSSKLAGMFVERLRNVHEAASSNITA